MNKFAHSLGSLPLNVAYDDDIDDIAQSSKLISQLTSGLDC